MLRLLRLLFVVVTISAVASGEAATPDERLSEFIKKWQSSMPQQQTPDQGYRREAIAQFTSLEALIKRGDFERAQQTLQNLNGYGVPPQLQVEWQGLLDDLTTQLAEREQQAAITRKKEVDALADKTRQVAATAETSAALDEIMIEIAALQTQRVSSSNNVLAQRSSQKLEGLANFVSLWSRFLDYKAAGDARQANNLLRDLMQGGSDFPVIPADQLQQRYLQEKKEPSGPIEAGRIAFEDVKFPEGMPQAVEKLEILLKSPSMSSSSSGWNPKEVLGLVQADQQVKAGDYSAAEQSLRTLDSSNTYQNLGNILAPIKNRIAADMLKGRIEQITGSKLQGDENANQFLMRTLDALKAEGKYVEMAKIISSVNRVGVRQGQSDLPWTSADASALFSYASGQQLEKAGDALMEVSEYRRVITAGQGGKYAPTLEAEQGLERLKKSNPEAFNDLNNVVLEELKSIRQELNQVTRMQQMQRNMPPGMMR